MGKTLYRSRDDRMLFGVCGGLGKYFDVDSNIIRVLWILAIFFSWGGMLVAYLLAALLIPEEPAKKEVKKKPARKTKKKPKKKKK
jgi:phage shock protein PspC (stress-responsive transcriptional regulator)